MNPFYILWLAIAILLLIYLFFGFLLYYKTPKMNSLLGYRTSWAFESEENWLYANKLTGKFFIIFGGIGLIIGIPLFLIYRFALDIDKIVIPFIFMFGILIIPFTIIIATVEGKLRRRRDEDSQNQIN